MILLNLSNDQITIASIQTPQYSVTPSDRQLGSLAHATNPSNA